MLRNALGGGTVGGCQISLKKSVMKMFGSPLLMFRGGGWVLNFQKKRYVTLEWPLARSLLKGAEVLGIRKPLKRAYGGGITEFVYAERHRFSGIDQPSYFLTSQERQSIVRHTLFRLQSDGSDRIGDQQFVPGQPISS